MGHGGHHSARQRRIAVLPLWDHPMQCLLHAWRAAVVAQVGRGRFEALQAATAAHWHCGAAFAPRNAPDAPATTIPAANAPFGTGFCAANALTPPTSAPTAPERAPEANRGRMLAKPPRFVEFRSV